MATTPNPKDQSGLEFHAGYGMIGFGAADVDELCRCVVAAARCKIAIQRCVTPLVSPLPPRQVQQHQGWQG